ncbi:MAG: xanthine dehydrogenase small subunit [Pseudomonadota bacterium]
MAESAVRFLLNGEAVTEVDAPATLTLLDYVRGRGLTGTKEGCAEGDCGACTVAVQRPGPDGTLSTLPLNACIMPLAMVHGAAVTTVEGLGATPHPVQAEMTAHHGSQCGFCTPGFVMSLWCRPSGAPVDRQAIEDRLAGNLCRCTGYGPILAAAAASAPAADALHDAEGDAEIAAALQAIGPLEMTAGPHTLMAPRDEATFAQQRAAHPDAHIIAGATDVGLWITKDLHDPGSVIFVGGVEALQKITATDDALVVGAAVTHDALHARVAGMSPALGELLRRFGGLQVRSAGTVGGNIANGSPIGDLAPALIAAGAELTVASVRGERTMALEDFFIAYGRQDLAADEYVKSVKVSLAGLRTLSCHKISKRFDSDISAVMLAASITLKDGVVEAVRVACGGMAATPKRAEKAEAALLGSAYDRDTIERAQVAILEDYSPISDLRASAAYRQKVVQNLLMRDFIERTAPEMPTRLAGRAVRDVAA